MSTPRVLHVVLTGVLLQVVCSVTMSQEQAISRRRVPAPVLEAFGKAYPGATVIGYSREIEKGTTVYEVESRQGAIHRDVTYMPDGAMVSVEETLPYQEVPASVRTAITSRYPKAKILVSEKVTKGSEQMYEFQLSIGKKKLEAKFEPDGKLVEEEKK